MTRPTAAFAAASLLVLATIAGCGESTGSNSEGVADVQTDRETDVGDTQDGSNDGVTPPSNSSTPPVSETPPADSAEDQPPLTLAPAPPTKTPTPAPKPPGDAVPVPPPGGPAEIAQADLAARLGVPIEEITVVSVAEVTWRDGSVGCPQPGMSYTQVLVNGSQIILDHDGASYHYHSRGDQDPFYCADPQDPLPPGGGGYGDV